MRIRASLIAMTLAGIVSLSPARGLVPLSATEVGGSADAQQSDGGGLRGLVPGQLPHLVEDVAVNIVVVGYDAQQIDGDELLSDLPASSEPIVRAANSHYGAYRPLGIWYRYHPRVVWADDAYAASVFKLLSSLGVPGAPTVAQRAYNDQQSNLRDITSTLRIPAQPVARWLAEHPPAGVDTSQPTVFFLNWYGHPQFEHHVYVTYGRPDPDTGDDLGVVGNRTQGIAEHVTSRARRMQLPR